MPKAPPMCYTEPICIACPVCGVGVCEWCLKDARERKWVSGAPVHLERISAVNKEFPPRPYPTGYREGVPFWE